MSGKNIKVQGNTQNVTKQCLENVKCLEKMANTWRGGGMSGRKLKYDKICCLKVTSQLGSVCS